MDFYFKLNKVLVNYGRVGQQHVPRKFDLVTLGGAEYNVTKVIWDYDLKRVIVVCEEK